MNEKFTPGPWNTEYSYRKDWYEIYGDEGMIMIAAAFNCQHKLDRANAALIAAAPDMYEALESSAAYFEMLESATGVEHGQLHTIRAALKKAQGER